MNGKRRSQNEIWKSISSKTSSSSCSDPSRNARNSWTKCAALWMKNWRCNSSLSAWLLAIGYYADQTTSTDGGFGRARAGREYNTIKQQRVVAREEEEDVKGRALFEEWLKMKFSKFSFIAVSGEPRDGLFTYFMDHGIASDRLLVMGAFGRGFISTFFKPSTSDIVLKAIDVPVFISHF